jgi:hypothetical protein
MLIETRPIPLPHLRRMDLPHDSANRSF